MAGRASRAHRTASPPQKQMELESHNDEMVWSPAQGNEDIAEKFSSSIYMGGEQTCFSPGRDGETAPRRTRRSFARHKNVTNCNYSEVTIPNIPIHMPSKSGSNCASEIHSLRIQGNGAFKLHNYNLACIKYSSSIHKAKKFPIERHCSLGLPLLYCNRAAAYLALGKPLEALQDCKLGMHIDPSFTRCYIRGATCLIRMGQFVEAREILNCLPRSPDVLNKIKEIDVTEHNFVHFFRQAGLLNDNNNLDEEIREFESLSSAIDSYRVLESSVPHSSALLAGIVSAHIQWGDFSGADRILEAILKVNSTNPPKWIGWCRVQTCFFKADYGQCDRNLSSLYELLSHGEDKMTDSDVALLKRIIEIPKQSSLSVIQGKINEIRKTKEHSNSLMGAKAYRKATELYSAALSAGALSPAMAAILFSNRAAAYHATENRVLALADCCKSVSILPQFAKPYSRIGVILSEVGLFNEARKFLEKAISFSQDAAKASEYRAHLDDIYAKGLDGDKPNYCLLLGIERTSNSLDIKKTYRKLALKLHPDKVLSSIRVTYQLDTGILLRKESQIRNSILDYATWLFKLVGEARDCCSES